MKKRIPTFVAGMLTMSLIGSLGISALAATGQLTLTVDPINIQVNGQTFQPKDAQGNSVPVFAYNGTTYAPLRALAEAYGLEVGYDQSKNMATVGEKAVAPTTTPTPVAPPSDDYSTWTVDEEAAYQEFKGMWNFEGRVNGNPFTTLSYAGADINNLIEFLQKHTEEQVISYTRRLALETFEAVNKGENLILFMYFDNNYADLWMDTCYPTYVNAGYDKENVLRLLLENY